MDQINPTAEPLSKAIHQPSVILDRVFTRVAHIFTKEDAAELARIEAQDATGDAVKYFLLARVPNFDAILAEEIEKFKKQGPP